MIQIESEVQHCLGQELAVARMQAVVAELAQRFPQQVHQVQMLLNEHRMDVQFAAYGYIVRWHAEVFDDQVSLTGTLPDSAAPFRGKMERAVVARVEEALRHAQWKKSA